MKDKRQLQQDILLTLTLYLFSHSKKLKGDSAEDIKGTTEQAIEAYRNNPFFHGHINELTALIMNCVEAYESGKPVEKFTVEENIKDIAHIIQSGVISEDALWQNSK